MKMGQQKSQSHFTATFFRGGWRHFHGTSERFISRWWQQESADFLAECPGRHFVQWRRGAQSHATLGRGTEDRGIDLKVWVSGILLTHTAHTNTRKLPCQPQFQAPEGPPCRRGMGGWEGQRVRERARERQVREWKREMTHSSECHHSAKDPH